MSTPALDEHNLQGNILRGYAHDNVRHLVLSVRDATAARAWLAMATSGDAARSPQITSAAPWDDKPSTCVNVGLTHAGLASLGLPATALASFPHEFAHGMASRAVKLGDTGPSAPEHWYPEWRSSDDVHLVVSVHGDDRRACEGTAARVLAAAGERAFSLRATLDGAMLPGDQVHFGYRDNIAQPHFAGVRDPVDRPDRQPLTELGTVLLGHATPLENVRWEIPQPQALGLDGCFNAFRVLEQQAAEFEDYLSASADQILADPLVDELLPPGTESTWDPPLSRRDALRELVAAKMMGRWRNGVPLVLSPLSPTPNPAVGPSQLNDFGFASDPDGLACPMASHVRRSNPRDARIVQRSTNRSRRIVRRGLPYGAAFDPDQPTPGPRGLLGVFLCASLIAQFEALQYDWINLGLQDPRITGTNDPLTGNNDECYSAFTIPVGTSSIVLRGFPSFVLTRGGAYLFLPSMSGVRHLAGMGR